MADMSSVFKSNQVKPFQIDNKSKVHFRSIPNSSMTRQHQEQTQGQPSSSEIQVQILREELDTANKKVDRYVHLVASLSEELDNLRRSICHSCKKKFVPSYAPVASSSHGAPLWRRIVSSHSTRTPLSGLPSVLPTITGGPSPNTSIPTTIQQNHTNPVNLASSQAPSSDTPISTHPSTRPDDEIQLKQAGWSVSHNPNIKQSLQIDLVKTFNFTAKVFCINFSPDGKYLAVGIERRSGKTHIYDVEKGLKICCFVDLYLEKQPLVWCMQFSPDNKCIAIASDKIRLWEIASKRARVAFTHSAPQSLCFSPNGRYLVAGEGNLVRIWSLRDGYSKILIDNANTTFSIAFSPNGRHIVSMGIGGLLRIWDARTGQLLDAWDGHTQDGLCLAFSPDGKGLVSGCNDGILRYWDVSSLVDMEMGRGRVTGGIPGQRFQQIRKFEGHSSSVRAVSFSPDHRWVASCSHDKSVRIWDPHTAEWQCTLHGHDSYARTVDFSPAGKYLASGGRDQRVRLWRYRGV